MSKIKVIRRGLFDVLFEDIIIKEIVVMFNGYIDEGKVVLVKLIRLILSDVFREVIVEGYIIINYVVVIRVVKLEVRRLRFTVDEYLKIY